MKEQFPNKEPQWQEPTKEEKLRKLEDGLDLLRGMNDKEFLKIQEEMELKRMKVLTREELMDLQREVMGKLKKDIPAMTYQDLLKLEKLMPEEGSKN